MTDQSASRQDGAKRSQLIEAAAAEFSRVGFDRAAVEAIAAAAGVAKGTVYLYFQSKEDLFLCVLWELKRELEAAVARLPEASRSESVRQFIRAHLQLADRSPDLFRCYTSALFGVNRGFQAAALETFAWQAEQLSLMVRRQHGTELPLSWTPREATLASGYINTTALVRGLTPDARSTTHAEEELLMALFRRVL